MYAEDA
jgi:hypothetical protein